MSETLAAQRLLICCFTAARLSGRFWGAPAVVAALAASSTSLFSWMLTWAGHHTRVTLAVGESLISFAKELTARWRSMRPGEGLRGWVRALIEGWLSIKNQWLS